MRLIASTLIHRSTWAVESGRTGNHRHDGNAPRAWPNKRRDFCARSKPSRPRPSPSQPLRWGSLELASFQSQSSPAQWPRDEV
jgi:hypothetical protein